MVSLIGLTGAIGIYAAIHRETGRIYIGQTRLCMEKRRRQHIMVSKSQDKHCIKFQKAIRELGADSFDFEVVEQCDPCKLLEREEFWIRFYDAAGPNGFNTCATPTRGYNYIVSEATRKKMSEKAKLLRHSAETIAKIKASNIGQKRSLATRMNISAALTGKKRKQPKSLETRAKLRASMLGKKLGPLSEEHKAKLRISSTGRKASERTRAIHRALMTARANDPTYKAKMLLIHKGAKRPEAAKANIRAACNAPEHIRKTRLSQLGRKKSPEHIANMRAARLGVKQSPEWIARRMAGMRAGRIARQLAAQSGQQWLLPVA